MMKSGFSAVLLQYRPTRTSARTIAYMTPEALLY